LGRNGHSGAHTAFIFALRLGLPRGIKRALSRNVPLARSFPMPKKSPPQSLRAVVDRITEQLTEILASEVERRVFEALRSVKTDVGGRKVDGRRGGRLCPVPGCGKPGAGPRNRWFCREHARDLSVSEQKGILERNKRLVAEGVPPERVVRLPPKLKRSRGALDMTCRVTGCTNRSRGPRAGFICDAHRAELTPEEQKEAREAYKARKRKGGEAAPVVVNRVPHPVPPIVRKAEASEA
jgi:hypothetical protein